MPWRINIQTDGLAVQKVGVHWPFAWNRRKGSLRGDTAGETGTRRGAEALGVTPRRTVPPGAGAPSPGPWKPSEVTGDAQPAARVALRRAAPTQGLVGRSRQWQSVWGTIRSICKALRGR